MPRALRDIAITGKSGTKQDVPESRHALWRRQPIIFMDTKEISTFSFVKIRLQIIPDNLIIFPNF